MTLQRKRTSACPGCCGRRSSLAEADVPDAKYGVPGLWSFLCCTDRGLVYLTETLADPAEGYPVVYSQHRPAGVVRLDRRWSPARDIRSACLELLGYGELPPFLTVMRTLGWRVHGIEPDARSAEIARRSSGAKVDPGLDEELYPLAHFDVITMNHVLEHVADPAAVLRDCFRLCRPGGLLGIVVPNWRALGHRLFQRHWYALEPPRHAVMYEPRTLERILQRAGFRIESVRTTSVRQWATAWRRSWRYRTGRRSPWPLFAAWEPSPRCPASSPRTWAKRSARGRGSPE